MNIIQFLTPKSDTFYLSSHSTIRQILETFDYHKFTVVPLLDEDGKYLSTVSEGDILRYIKNNCNFNISMAENTFIENIAVYRPYQALDITCSLKDAFNLLLQQNFIPIVDDRGIYIGIIKRREILEHLSKLLNNQI